MQDTLLDVLAENFGSCCIDNIEQRRVKHVWFLTIHDDNATGSMCIIWIISPTWVLGLTFWIYLAWRVAFTPNMVKVSSSLIMIWFLGWDPSCQTIQYRRYYPSTAGPWPQIWTPRSSHPLANIKQQQGNAYLDLIDCCIEWCENKELIMLLYIFFSWLILCTLSHLSAIIMDLWSVFWTQRFLVFVFGLFSIFVSTLVAGLCLGSRKIDGSHIRNNNQCSDKLTSVPRLGSLQSLGLEDDIHVCPLTKEFNLKAAHPEPSGSSPSRSQQTWTCWGARRTRFCYFRLGCIKWEAGCTWPVALLQIKLSKHDKFTQINLMIIINYYLTIQTIKCSLN